MLDRENLKALFTAVVKANPSAISAYSYQNETYSYNALDETLRKELNEYYLSDKQACFRLVEEVMDEAIPTQLINVYGMFAEVKTFGQSEKPVFKRRVGKGRAKQFVTHAGLAGRYETFKLGEEAFEISTNAMGAAAKIGFEEYLDGRANMAELVQIIMDGMQELIYKEIGYSLIGALNQLPGANRVSAAGFDEAAMDSLISTASAYGSPVIYCTREFASKMIPATAAGTNWDAMSNGMKEQLWNQGYLANYKGCPVVIMPQSLTDETNSRKVMDPGYCWIIPAGANTKPVKVAFEGTTHMREITDNDDWSTDVQIYRKVGVGVMMTSNICSYVDTELAGHLENPYHA